MKSVKLRDLADGCFMPWLEDAMDGMTTYELAKAVNKGDPDSFAAKAYAWRHKGVLPKLRSFADLCEALEDGGAYVVPASTMRALMDAMRYARRNGWRR